MGIQLSKEIVRQKHHMQVCNSAKAKLCLSGKPLLFGSWRVAVPLQRGNPFSLQGETHQNIVKMFVLWLYLLPDERKWFPHLLSFLFSFSRCCFPTLLLSLPHPGFGRIYLLLPAASPSVPGDKLEADCRAGLRSSTATAASPAVDAGADNCRCVMATAVWGTRQSLQTTWQLSSAVPCPWLLLWGTAGTLLLNSIPQAALVSLP